MFTFFSKQTVNLKLNKCEKCCFFFSKQTVNLKLNKCEKCFFFFSKQTVNFLLNACENHAWNPVFLFGPEICCRVRKFIIRSLWGVKGRSIESSQRFVPLFLLLNQSTNVISSAESKEEKFTDFVNTDFFRFFFIVKR